MKKAAMLSALFGLFGNLLLVSNATAAETDVDVGGSWSLTFCYIGHACGSTSLDINQFGPFFTFSTGDDGEGVGLAVDALAVLHFTVGCMPNYIALAPTATAMSGRMKCTDDSGDRGTWEAVRVPPSAAVEEVGAGISASGALE